ncbi:MAG: AMP-binding protein [Dehalococcoidia bacterium]|nr:AMP-binding protein [Dehalococcoidia bacterium]
MAIETRYTPEIIEEFTRKGYWSDKIIPDRLDERARLTPDKEAVVDSYRRVTYAQMARMVDRMALGFLELGIRKGERVTIQFPNRVEGLCLFYALGKIGAIVCPVVPYYRGAEVGYILESSESVAYIAPREFGGFDYAQMIEELRPRLPKFKHLIVAGGPVPAGAVSLDQILETPLESKYPPDYLRQFRPDANDVLAFVYTSGTESSPKGPIWTHNGCHNSRWFNEAWKINENETVLNLAPIFHALGLTEAGYVTPMVIGARMVMMDVFSPEEALRLIHQEKANVLLGVPPQLISILNHPGLGKWDLSSLRLATASGGPTPGEVIRQLREKIGCNFIAFWGMTECVVGMITRLDDPVEVPCNSIGRPASDAVEIRVYSEDHSRVLGPGEPGEMAVRGPMVFGGYYKDPERTKQVFNEEGWFLTGDSVMMREDGNICFVGRKKDIINRGGEKISPREVEELLFTFPKVMNVAVVGMPDQRLGEKSCAYIIPKPGETITFDEVVNFLKEKRIANFKLPERVEIVDALPMTASGKIKKNVLRDDVVSKMKAEGIL